MQISAAQLPTLLSNWGGNGETTYLWITGFPVFDQGSAGSQVNQFQLLDAGGAYQAVFNNPIQDSAANNAVQINTPIRLLGTNYTIINETPPGQSGSRAGGLGTTSGSTTAVIAGGKMYLASALSPLQTIYVGHNITSAPWTITLQDLGQPNSNGISTASVALYYNGALTNQSSLTPGTTTKFNVTGHTVYVNVNATFAGLYAYQKWAKLQLYTNVYPVVSGQAYNQTTNPGWNVRLLWTNTTSASGGSKALQSIVIYNTTPVTLNTGQSLSFIQNPQKYKLTFVGETLGSGSFDPVSIQSSSVGAFSYQNLATQAVPNLAVTNVTEPAQELTVTSSIPNAFSYVGQTGSSVIYDLTPFALVESGNTLQAAGKGVAIATPSSLGTGNAVVLDYEGANSIGGSSASGAAQWISASQPLTAVITGYTSNAAGSSPTSVSVTFTSPNALVAGGTIGANSVLQTSAGLGFYNVTGIQLSRALPGSLSVTVYGNAVVDQPGTNAVKLATLQSVGTTSGTYGLDTPVLVYSQTGKTYQGVQVITGNAVVYNQQNGQPTNSFQIQTNPYPTNILGAGYVGQYYEFVMGEVAVPTNTAATDYIEIGIDNNSAGIVGQPTFQLNYSAITAAATLKTTAGTKNNVTYGPSSQSTAITVPQGFRTERGSKVVSITPTTVSVNLAKATDTLQFQVGAANTTVGSAKTYKLYGPYTVGQATNIANVSIGQVNASVKLGSGTVYSVSGIGNLTATPSVTTAYQPVWLKNLTTTPLVVLDTQASPGSNLILIGSGYVNALSQQVQNSYNVSITPSTANPVVQAEGNNKILVAGYTAQQTVTAGNSFIQQLYAQAH